MTNLAMHRVDAWRMIRRRAKAADLDAEICCHTFRATGITAYLDNNGTLKNVQAWRRTRARARQNFMTERAKRLRFDVVEPIVI